jgi:hypothetical protein
MSETKVYRIEHPNIRAWFGDVRLGGGPYYIEGRKEVSKELIKIITQLVDEHNTSSEHPSLGADIYMDDEFSSDINYKLISACPNISALQYWFGDFFDSLLDEGMVIVEYTVKKSFIGNSNIQCGFYPEDIIRYKRFT